jgi:hypothetical protein
MWLIQQPQASPSKAFNLGGFFMSAVIYKLATFTNSPEHKKRVRRSRKRLYYLGTHSYSGIPGSSWRTEYWIKRVGGGHQWELYCTAEGYGRQKVLYETFNRVELMEYFSSVQFDMDATFFETIGIHQGETVINLDEYR